MDRDPPQPEGPVSGADLFTRTARQPGGQAERARYFEAHIAGLTERIDWSAFPAGTATDGTILYKKEGQIRLLAITTDGGVYTGSWQEEVTATVVDGRETLECHWSSPGWRRW